VLEEIVAYLKNVFYVVISDKGYEYDTQKTLPFYSRIAKGGPFPGETGPSQDPNNPQRWIALVLI